ncbi:hypothetical protein AC629_40725 [Bradyrhizobium sp. NAS80.1]|uniref:hypothetical protein n=1 Tax=Bradyrhizobium sp. NAS80.1 TaxID=1680159 RepID=UPI00095F8031|nr:hypothetical protein [Bradyrhizobium sp. NAS80.1]OKO70133.1 hypothetical protein AC629_40725 [Bradyrhizobium sp. NAS80.1]
MADVTSDMPDWLAALRCPMYGDVKLSHAWKASVHIPEILEGFGPRHPPARRWIVIKIDKMAIDLWVARKRQPAFGVQEAKENFASTAKAAKNLFNKLREPQVRHAIVMANAKRQRTKSGPKWLSDMDLGVATPLDEIDLALEFVKEGAEEVFRDPDIYYRVFGRRLADSRKKSLERTLLWEPLFDLMYEFGIEDLSEYQELTKTVGSLHRALGIDSPNTNLLRQVTSLWRKRQLNSAVGFRAS